MKKKTLVSIILTLVLAAAASMPMTAFAAASPSPYVFADWEKPSALSEAETLYYENAVDAVTMRYQPADFSLPPVPVATVFTFTHPRFKTVTENALYTEDCAVMATSEHFVFAMLKNKTNPYERDSADYKNFASEAAQAEQLLLNEEKIGEIENKAFILGQPGLNYYFHLPELRKVAAVRNITGKEKDRIDFISVTREEHQLATLRVYDKYTWESLVFEEEKEAAGSVVLDFMDYVFTLTAQAENPYIPGSPDATGFDAAYRDIQKAVSKAYLYNPGGVKAGILNQEPGGVADLYVGQLVFQDKVLFDAESRPLFPARALSEALGYQIDWDPATSSFVILKGDSLVAARSVEASFTKENYKDADEFSCAMIDGSVYIDLDFVVNTLNCAVSLNETENILTVRAR